MFFKIFFPQFQSSPSLTLLQWWSYVERGSCMQNENQRDLNFERELKNSRLFLWANLLEAGTHNFTRLSQKGKFEFASKILTRTHGTCQKNGFLSKINIFLKLRKIRKWKTFWFLNANEKSLLKCTQQDYILERF